MNCELSKYLLNSFNQKKVASGVFETTPPPLPSSFRDTKRPILNRVKA